MLASASARSVLLARQYFIQKYTTTTTMVSPIPCEELTLQCSDGMVLAAQEWFKKGNPSEDGEGETKEKRILCLHGKMIRMILAWHH